MTPKRIYASFTGSISKNSNIFGKTIPRHFMLWLQHIFAPKSVSNIQP